MSKVNKNIIIAKNKGYTIDKNGDVYGPSNIKLKLYLKNGYYSFAIRIANTRSMQRIPVHKYQAYIKFNILSSIKLHVRHKNGISTDNSWGNILIGSSSDNSNDKKPEVRKDASLQASWSKNKIHAIRYVNILNDRNLGMTYDDLKDKYNISKSCLSYYLGNGKNKISKEFHNKYLEEAKINILF